MVFDKNDLVNGLGGLVGLILGVSLLTLADYIVDVLIFRFL